MVGQPGLSAGDGRTFRVKVGAVQLEITPQLGLDLSGFAVRPQPSTSVLDPLWIRGLYCEEGGERFLWLHADVLAVDEAMVDRLRCGIESEIGLPSGRILISTTHTHSGPVVMPLTACGELNRDYVARLEEQFKKAARLTLRDLEDCQLVFGEGKCGLAIDRRKGSQPHTDPTVGALGWRRRDESYKAAWLNYAMHPVCLCGSEISADWLGETSRALAEQLPGRPVVLVFCGACGNINPPGVGVTPDVMRGWGREIAESVRGALLRGESRSADDVALNVQSRTVQLPEENWSIDQIEEYAAKCLADPAGERVFGDRFKRAVGVWRENMIARRKRGDPYFIQGELTAISFGRVAMLAVNAEIFSRFAGLANPDVGRSVYVTGCANGMIGYVAPAEAYAKGGYEIAWAMLFYNLPRPQKGAFELLAQNARELLAATAAMPKRKS
jgi:hypothetical protein